MLRRALTANNGHFSLRDAFAPWHRGGERDGQGTADQVSAARRFLAGLIDGFSAADDALLCLSEVVTNAIQHSHSARPSGLFTVRAACAPGRLRVEVGGGGPWQPNGHHHDHGGRGLAILSALTRWDTTTDDEGHRTVWFEITA